MATDKEINDALKKLIPTILREKGALPFRKIEAWVVLNDVDTSTFNVQRALHNLVDGGTVILQDDFKYSVVPEQMLMAKNVSRIPFAWRHKGGKQKIYQPGESWLVYWDEIPARRMLLDGFKGVIDFSFAK